MHRRHQQYECKWYIPLADLTFQTLDDSDSCHSIQVLPEHEIEEMKIKISALKSEIQKERVRLVWGTCSVTAALTNHKSTAVETCVQLLLADRKSCAGTARCTLMREQGS